MKALSVERDGHILIVTIDQPMSRRLTDLVGLTEPDVARNIFARAVVSFQLGFAQR